MNNSNLAAFIKNGSLAQFFTAPEQLGCNVKKTHVQGERRGLHLVQ